MRGDLHFVTSKRSCTGSTSHFITTKLTFRLNQILSTLLPFPVWVIVPAQALGPAVQQQSEMAVVMLSTCFCHDKLTSGLNYFLSSLFPYPVWVIQFATMLVHTLVRLVTQAQQQSEIVVGMLSTCFCHDKLASGLNHILSSLPSLSSKGR